MTPTPLKPNSTKPNPTKPNPGKSDHTLKPSQRHYKPHGACINLTPLKRSTPDNLSPDEAAARLEARHQELAARDRNRMETDLRLMLDYVGLEDEPTSVLAGNHPYEGPMQQTELGARPAATEPPPKLRPKYPAHILKEMTGTIPKRGQRRSDPHRRPWLPADLSAEALGLPLKEGETDTLNPLELNPIALARRLEIFRYRSNLNITQIAAKLGRSRAYVRNHLRLLDLPPAIKDHVEAGRLTEGHARIIGKMRDPIPMARLTIRRQLSVRQVELMARRLRYIGPHGALLRETAIPNRKTMEDMLEDVVGLKVRVHDRAGRGKIEIHYNSPDEAQSIANAIGHVFIGLSEDDLERDY